MNQLLETLKTNSRDLDEVKATYAVVGGIALSLRVEPRFTRDLDLAIAVASDQEAESINGALMARGYRMVMQLEHETKKRLATMRLTPPRAGGIVLDLLFSSCGIEPEIVPSRSAVTTARRTCRRSLIDCLRFPAALDAPLRFAAKQRSADAFGGLHLRHFPIAAIMRCLSQTTPSSTRKPARIGDHPSSPMGERSSMSFEAAVHAKAIHLDLLSLEMCAAAGSGHPTSAMSLGHIVTVLMYHTMRWLPDHPRYPTSDRLVLSEGHAVPIIYAAFRDLGAAIGKGDQLRPTTHNDLLSFREDDSLLDGHPNPMEGFPFFDAATGSLGQGLSVAAGLGFAARHDEIDKRIYCIIGDGEAREGQIWEAIDFIADHKLTNVLPIFNCNGYGQAGTVSAQQSADTLVKKLEAAGYMVGIVDGHSPSAIKAALDYYIDHIKDGQPMAMVAKTVKGWGAPSMQGSGWHGKPASGEKLQKAIEELKSTGVALTSALVSGADDMKIYPPTEHDPSTREVKNEEPMSFDEAMKHYDMTTILRGGRFGTRKAYGLALRALGHANSEVFALDADVSNSTFSEWFAHDRALKDRFVECKIGEQNMISVGAGLSAAGKVPFCSTFAKFVTRAYDQLEMAINSGANIKVVGSHSGISLAADGPSQMSLPDMAWFRSFATIKDHHGGPGCYLLQPADAYAAYALTMRMADHHGACYMRTHRPDVEFLYNENTIFDMGRMEVLTEGRDLLIVTAGFMVHECNKALNALDKMGVDATLVDLYSIPFPVEQLLDLANANNGNILTVEDNYGGGLGSAVADVCAEAGDAFTIEQMHVRRIPKSARSEDDILKQCGLDHASIVKKAASMLGVVSV